LAQDAFLKAYHAQDQLTDPGSARAWIYRIAYRCFLDSYRRDRRRAELVQLQIADDASAAPKNGLRLDLEVAMAALPSERRVCVMLGLVLGHSHREIVTITGLPLGTVKSHIDRGRAALRDQLSAYEDAS